MVGGNSDSGHRPLTGLLVAGAGKSAAYSSVSHMSGKCFFRQSGQIPWLISAWECFSMYTSTCSRWPASSRIFLQNEQTAAECP